MATDMVETVYGTPEEGHVMSEKVSSLATNIYKEFERMIKKYDEDVVKELMPLVVGILENLDLAYSEKQEIEVELELIRDDNEQLLTQYEREKQLRKGAEQKYLEVEDTVEGEKKELEDKVESLESIVRMLELKSKNTSDHLSRMEEKEAEMKKEYNKLHERYTELFRTHMDYMERTKILIGTDRIAELANSPRTKGFQLPNLKAVNLPYGQGMSRSVNSPPSGGSFDLMSPRSGKDSNVSIRSELSDLESPDVNKRKTIILDNRTATSDKEQNTDSVDVRESGTATGTKRSDEHFTSTPSKTETSENESLKNLRESECSNSVVSDVKENAVITQPRERTSKSVVTNDSNSDSINSIKNTDIENTLHINDSERYEGHISVDDGYEEFARSPGLGTTLAHIVATTPELDDMEDSLESQHTNSSSRTPARNNDSIFDELAVDHADIIGDMDYGADITDSEDENDRRSTGSVSDNFFGMGKELENIILENNELLATKNALNIVKDDLIAKVDELTSEQEILREEITSLQTMRSRLQQRVTQLEEDLKKSKEELEKKNQAAKEDEEDELPLAQRKRFTRVEMARVLMERNQYKERLMELQEAVRWTEMIRASREHPELSSKKKSSIWNFSSFSNLVAPAPVTPPKKKDFPPAQVV